VQLGNRGIYERARQRVTAQLIDTPPPVPWNLDAWVNLLEVARDRPIDLVPFTYRTGSALGAWHRLRGRDVIAYPANTSVVHQDYIVLHEIAHMLCEHLGRCVLSEDEVARRAPDLSDTTLHHLLTRVTAEDGEAEAEAIATVIMRAATTRPMVDPATRGETGRRARQLVALLS
jgi:hypothetical protein